MTDSYTASLETWRQTVENSLRAENSWLTVSGLCWLKEGENPFGTDPANEIVLPPNSAPAFAGAFYYKNGEVTLRANGDITVNGEPANDKPLQADFTGTPDRIRLRALSMTVIRRGGRMGIRLFDNEAPRYKAFTGLNWYPPNEQYRVRARFIPHENPIMLPIMTVIGDLEEAPSPGKVLFTLDGQEHELLAESSDITQRLFLNFKDATNGKTTYPSSRFLYTGGVENGEVIVDFNRARNPPCAYTDYATCPLPPKENVLTIPIPVGEMKFDH
ncbi:MAG: DUF1684 domain-containing protein [Anaerolineales bacterium]